MSFTRGDLKDLDKIWKDADMSGASQGEVPEGKYQAKISAVELAKSSGGRPQCKFVYKIVGGPEELIGKELTTYDGLVTAQNMGFFARKLKRLGVPIPGSFEEVAECVEGTLGAVCDIQVKYKDDFLNVYVNKLVSKGKGSDESEGEEEEKPEKPKAKAKVKEADGEDENESENEEEEEKKKEDEGEEEEEKQEEQNARNFPELKEIDEMKPPALVKLLKQFKIKEELDKKKHVLLIGVAKALVSIMEDDEYETPEKHLSIAAKWLGLTPEEGRKKLLRQIIKKLGG